MLEKDSTKLRSGNDKSHKTKRNKTKARFRSSFTLSGQEMDRGPFYSYWRQHGVGNQSRAVLICQCSVPVSVSLKFVLDRTQL